MLIHFNGPCRPCLPGVASYLCFSQEAKLLVSHAKENPEPHQRMGRIRIV
jgi:hypothetical protein